MADDRPAESEVEALARLQRELEDLRSTVMVRVGRNPTGTIAPVLLTTAPTDTLLLQGQTVNRDAYPVLWKWASDNNLVGAAGVFGVGNGTSTFVLPDMRGRVLLGAGPLAVGAKVGADSLTLAVTQMPAHDHNPRISIANHSNHSHTFNTQQLGGHGGHTSGTTNVTQGGSGVSLPASYNNNFGNHGHGGETTQDSAGSHSFSASEDTIGGGQPVDVRQASYVVNWLIWT